MRMICRTCRNKNSRSCDLKISAALCWNGILKWGRRDQLCSCNAVEPSNKLHKSHQQSLVSLYGLIRPILFCIFLLHFWTRGLSRKQPGTVGFIQTGRSRIAQDYLTALVEQKNTKIRKKDKYKYRKDKE